MDYETRSDDKYTIDGETRWRLERLTETLNLANRIPSNIHIPDRSYKALISLVNEELWRVDSKIKDLEKHSHTAATLVK